LIRVGYVYGGSFCEEFLLEMLSGPTICWQQVTLSFRCSPIALGSSSPQNIKTEDDVLHIKNLPSCNDCLGQLQQDAELLLSYLTVPYLRIPLILTLFTTEDRIHALKSEELQATLDSVIFEPDKFLYSDITGWF
jgi:hypothetical protein